MTLIFDAFYFFYSFQNVRFRYGWLDYYRNATTDLLRTRSNSRTLTSFFSLEIKALFFKRNARHDFPSASIALCLTVSPFKCRDAACPIIHNASSTIPHIQHTILHVQANQIKGPPTNKLLTAASMMMCLFFHSPRLVLLHSLLIPNSERRR